MSELPDRPRLLDVGCGPGRQTIELARLTNGDVVGSDFYQIYLDTLASNAAAAGVADHIRPIQGSMTEMTFADRSFDAIWAEGAIYIIGFERGLTEWRRLLTERGYVAVSHLSWLRSDIPDEPRRFWNEKYPAIASVDDNLHTAAKAGYENVGHFTLPKSAWWNEYYNPLQLRLQQLREEYRDDPAALDVLQGTQDEIDLYKRYADYYGYEFYVMRNHV